MAKGKTFKGFSDEQMKRIAGKLGFDGPVEKFGQFLQSNPAMAAKYAGLEAKAKMKFAEGGMAINKTVQESANALLNANAPKSLDQGQSVVAPKENRFNPNNMAVQNAGALQQANQMTASTLDFKPGQETGGPYYGEQRKAAQETGGQMTEEQNKALEDKFRSMQTPPGFQQPPADKGQQMYTDYQAKQQQYMMDYEANAPESVKQAKSQAEQLNQQLQQKYADRVGEIKNYYTTTYGNRIANAQTQEERNAIQMEMQNDAQFKQLNDKLSQDMRQDPLSTQMQELGKTYSDYMSQGAQQFGAENPSPSIGDVMVGRALQPGVPEGGAYVPATVATTPEQEIATTAGQVGDASTVTAATATTEQAASQPDVTATTVEGAKVEQDVRAETEATKAAQGEVSQEAQVQAAQMDPTSTQVGTIPAAQIEEATRVEAPQSRTLQSGEMIEAAADAKKATAFVEEVQAATANPSAAATVKGQLDNLMADFDEGQTPAWAAGALRNATAQMAARGLSASSMAGQALVQAAMESALPIAQADAATTAQFEITNLSNRQSRAMLAAQQRAQFMGMEFDQQFQARVANASKISDIANMNFNAEQQIALENARMAQTVDLANLSNRQAMVIAEASQIASLETQNLNNRQQASVQNAQAFLQMDLTNLANEQQTELFKSQQNIQALLSDQASENAARQFNASSQTQVDQFNTSLASQISQFNTTQSNAMNQFNAEQTNVVGKFNAEVQNQRDQFNAQNQLLVEQSNAQWRRQVATLDTAAVNAANQFNATAVLDISNTAYANLWQQARDTMEWAWTSAENERQRDTSVSIAKIGADATKYAAEVKEDAADSAAWGGFIFDLVTGWN
jgi:hypothetical protein